MLFRISTRHTPAAPLSRCRALHTHSPYGKGEVAAQLPGGLSTPPARASLPALSSG
ncbi:hypothetical protein CPT_Shaeky_070 [Streptomyces phage Shaeky]|uniref:Uncharacterized protein n=1 Tax=Streptomyces phage Shaeky TaxID=2767586 RepID=A0A873WE51_9CAUD|nr:hypothetical protein CPT_Shaeky_070 [Streptomyces phage Shaeky]